MVMWFLKQTRSQDSDSGEFRVSERGRRNFKLMRSLNERPSKG